MIRYVFSIAVFILWLSSAISSQTQTLSFKVAGVSRSYYMHVPTGVLSNPPLVFMLHGHGGTGSSEENSTKWFPVADKEKFIAVYPNAISGNWDVSATSNDLKFILAIIDSLDAKYHIDRNRVYAAGFSQGAAMCHMCGCAYSDVFAALAPASGGLGGPCTLKRPVPVMMSFGTKDMQPAATFMNSVIKWAQLDSLPTTNPKITRPYPPANSQSVVTRITFGPGKDGVLVIADSAQNGGHEWPMDTRTKKNNTEEAWAFFKQFSLKNTTAVHPQTVSVVHKSVSASYSSGTIRLKGVGENANVRVLDTKGRIIASATVMQHCITFNNVPSGAYIVSVNGLQGSATTRLIVP
jgi:polyhydroxybutyrate depolymerase